MSSAGAYVGSRRRGIAGYASMFRGTVGCDGGVILQTRSPRLAAEIADLLNGEPVERTEVEDPSPVPRYTVTSNTPAGWAAGLWSESTTRNASRFGYGIVARGRDRELLDRIAALLNEVDPSRRPPIVHGFGWW